MPSGFALFHDVPAGTIFGELDSMAEYKTQFVFKGKKKDIVKVSISNLPYPNQQTDVEIPNDLRDHVIV